MKKQLCLSTLAIIATAVLAGCGGNTATTPASPAPVTSVTVASVTLASTAISGSAFQISATARLSDGTTRDVTSSSTWTTSNASLAVVSATGLLTVMGSGEVDVRATYQSVVGTLKILVSGPPPQISFLLGGVVHEVPPGSRVLSNVRLEIIGGSDSGAFTMTDDAGLFRFNALSSGVVSMQAVRDGYQVWRITNLTIDRDRQLEVSLFPTPPTNAGGVSATARCNDGSWSWVPARADACTDTGGIAYGVCPGVLCDGLSRSQ